MFSDCSEDGEGVLVSCLGKIGGGAGMGFDRTGAVGKDGVSRVDGRSWIGVERGNGGNEGRFNRGNELRDGGGMVNRGNELGSTGNWAIGGFTIGNPRVPSSEAPTRLVRSKLALVK